MGDEVRLVAALPERAVVEALLRSVPGFEAYDPPYDAWRFRRIAPGRPRDAEVHLEPTGLLLCCHVPDPALLEELERALAAQGIRSTRAEV